MAVGAVELVGSVRTLSFHPNDVNLYREIKEEVKIRVLYCNQDLTWYIIATLILLRSKKFERII
jgi:hypothetical protein